MREIKTSHGQETNNPNQCKCHKPKHMLRQIVSTGMKKVLGNQRRGGRQRKGDLK